MRLFREEAEPLIAIDRSKEDIPELFRQYCVERGTTMHCPKDFGHMEIGWYMNHSKKPNAHHRNYNYYASRDIPAGEEITVSKNRMKLRMIIIISLLNQEYKYT